MCMPVRMTSPLHIDASGPSQSTDVLTGAMSGTRLRRHARHLYKAQTGSLWHGREGHSLGLAWLPWRRRNSIAWMEKRVGCLLLCNAGPLLAVRRQATQMPSVIMSHQFNEPICTRTRPVQYPTPGRAAPQCQPGSAATVSTTMLCDVTSHHAPSAPRRQWTTRRTHACSPPRGWHWATTSSDSRPAAGSAVCRLTGMGLLSSRQWSLVCVAPQPCVGLKSNEGTSEDTSIWPTLHLAADLGLVRAGCCHAER